MFFVCMCVWCVVCLCVCVCWGVVCYSSSSSVLTSYFSPVDFHHSSTYSTLSSGRAISSDTYRDSRYVVSRNLRHSSRGHTSTYTAVIQQKQSTHSQCDAMFIVLGTKSTTYTRHALAIQPRYVTIRTFSWENDKSRQPVSGDQGVK